MANKQLRLLGPIFQAQELVLVERWAQQMMMVVTRMSATVFLPEWKQ